MIRVPIDSKTITKFKDAMSQEECDFLTNYVIEKTNYEIDPSLMPWFQKNIIYYNTVTDVKVTKIVDAFINSMCKKFEEVYGEKVYPHLTTIVLWKEGQKMGRHHDQGNPGEPGFEMRDYTTVLYLNDDYVGGNTFIRNDGVADDRWRKEPEGDFKDFISVPEKGAAVLFYGGDINAHGVEEVKSGTRVVLSTWYSKDSKYIGK